MNGPSNFYQPDDGGFDYVEQALHDVITRGVRAGLISNETPTSTAVRLLDRAGAISRDDRELLEAAYPEYFQPAHQIKVASEFVSPQLEI